MDLIELICVAKNRAAEELQARGIGNLLLRNSLRDSLVECGLSCEECHREKAWRVIIVQALAQVSSRTR